MKKIYFYLFLILILTGCSKAIVTENQQIASSTDNNQQTEQIETEKKATNQIAVFISPIDFDAAVYSSFVKKITELGLKPVVVSIQNGEAISGDTKVKIDRDLNLLDPDDYQAIVFLGGNIMKELSLDEAIVSTAQNFLNAGKILVLSKESLSIGESLMPEGNEGNIIEAWDEDGESLAYKLKGWL